MSCTLELGLIVAKMTITNISVCFNDYLKDYFYKPVTLEAK